jgi:hypothetical protein
MTTNTDNMFYWATRNSDGADTIPFNFEEWKKDPVLFASLLHKELGNIERCEDSHEDYTVIEVHKDTESFEDQESEYNYGVINYSLNALFNFLEKCAKEIVFETPTDMISACKKFLEKVNKYTLVQLRLEQLKKAADDAFGNEEVVNAELEEFYRNVSKNIREEQHTILSQLKQKN